MKVTYWAVARHAGYWVLVIPDLSERSKADRAEGAQFKRFLKKRGFLMLQPSLYTKFTFTEASANSACESVLKFSPKKGKIKAVKKGTVLDVKKSIPLEEQDAFFKQKQCILNKYVVQ